MNLVKRNLAKCLLTGMLATLSAPYAFAETTERDTLTAVVATQTIRGHISDVASGEPITGAIVVIDGKREISAMSDMEGCFCIERVAVGRHTIQATLLGYEPIVLKEQLLSSGKEMVLNLQMRECVNMLGEVTVKPRVNKQQPLNEMALAGARMFSVEEASRYAGGMADPARTASMFAGVAASGATNGISIHGNSPQMLQWRIEGIEVNNPNHFGEITEAGGGVFTSLNGIMLSNSDFLTGAMPAEYGNALSGAFDMKMRVGNNEKFEHAIQLGTLGVDVASEGPLGKKGTKASYLINYRYSFLELAKKLHAINMEKETLDYQDLSFRLNFPTRKAGTFGVWFTGLYDRYKNDLPDQEDWETLWDMNDSHSRQASYAGGINHTILFKSGGKLRSSVAMTGSYIKLGQNDYDNQLVMTPDLDGRNNQWNVIIDVLHQHKFSPRYTMQNGFNHQHLDFDLRFDACEKVGEPMRRVYASEGVTGLTRLFSSHKLMLTHRLTAVGGLNVMWFNLNNQWLVEPRASLSYKTSNTSSLALAYAMNSRKENTDVYFVEVRQNDGKTLTNKDLGLTRSHHLSLTFSQRLGDDALLKIEPYYQYVFDVPVEQGSTFSVINNNIFYTDRHLVNEGAGRNYGIDLTLEHYLKNGFYGMFTATLFKSEYRDAQGLWHNSRHDRRYITNVLGGKEWMVGKRKSNIIGINARVTLQGGDRYTPADSNATFDEVATMPTKSIPEDASQPFSEQLGMNVGYAFSVKYTINKRNVAHHLILEYLKMKSYHGQTFTLDTHEIVEKYTSLTFPNIAYRIEY